MKAIVMIFAAAAGLSACSSMPGSPMDAGIVVTSDGVPLRTTNGTTVRGRDWNCPSCYPESSGGENASPK